MYDEKSRTIDMIEMIYDKITNVNLLFTLMIEISEINEHKEHYTKKGSI